MVWEDVVAFRAVCEELHYTRAARRLHVSQPTLTMRIKRLERHLGTRLLDRTSRSVRMTAAGETLFAWARETQFSWLDVRRRIEDLARPVGSARWTLGTAHVELGTLLPLVDGAVDPRASYGVSVHPTVRSLLAAVRAGTVDVAVFGRSPDAPGEDEPGLRVDESAARPLRLYFPAPHPAAAEPTVDLSSFAGHDWISLGPGPDAVLLDAWRAAGIAPRIRHHLDEIRIALYLVATHDAVMVGPPMHADMPGVVSRPFRDAPRTCLAVATPVDRPPDLHHLVLDACNRQVEQVPEPPPQLVPLPRLALEIS